MIVATVYRSGGTVFTPEWVFKLRRSVACHIGLGYRAPTDRPSADTWTFRVLTDVDAFGPMGIRMAHDWPKWYGKAELFRPGLFNDRVLYMDLDTLPVDDFSDIARYDGPFAMLSDFYQPHRPASGMMAWGLDDPLTPVYDAFAAHPHLSGRLDYWLERRAPKPARLQKAFPDKIVSLKAHAKNGPPAGAAIVCGHGNPRFSDPKAGWAHKEWVSL